jgi:hypothetical protein
LGSEFISGFGFGIHLDAGHQAGVGVVPLTEVGPGIRNPFKGSAFRHAVAITILIDLVALVLAFFIIGSTSNVGWTIGGAAGMGTVYTITVRKRATIPGVLYFTAIGALLAAIYPLISVL